MLGELEVSDGDVELPIRGAKQRALLLLLLVHARETVQAERLADELWGDDLPAGGANALQALVSKLRRALGPLSEVCWSRDRAAIASTWPTTTSTPGASRRRARGPGGARGR